MTVFRFRLCRSFFITFGKPKALPACGGDAAQGIEAEIPQDCRRRNASGVFEELERKARFFAVLPQKMRPKNEKAKQTPLPAAYANRFFQN
jgi:hypothetical protein